MSLVRLNIKSRIELETRVLAAALKQSYERGDAAGARSAHRQLSLLLKESGQMQQGRVVVATDGIPEGLPLAEGPGSAGHEFAGGQVNAVRPSDNGEKSSLGEDTRDSEAAEVAAQPTVASAQPAADTPSPAVEAPAQAGITGAGSASATGGAGADAAKPPFQQSFLRHGARAKFNRTRPTARPAGESAGEAARPPAPSAPGASAGGTDNEPSPVVAAGEAAPASAAPPETADDFPGEAGGIVDADFVVRDEEQVSSVVAEQPAALPPVLPEVVVELSGEAGLLDDSAPLYAVSEDSQPAEAPSADFDNQWQDPQVIAQLEMTPHGTVSDTVSTSTADDAEDQAAEPGDAESAENKRHGLYRLLNVSQMSPFDEIHKNFLRRVRNLLREIKANKALRYEKLAELQRVWIAHDILTDPVTRTDYDFRDLGLRGNTEAAVNTPDDQQDQRFSTRTPLRIGELLQCAGLLESAELEIACDMHKACPEVQFGTFLVRQGFIQERDLDSVLIGQKLLRAGAISVAQFQVAMDLSGSRGSSISDTLIEKGYIAQNDLEEKLNPAEGDVEPPPAVQIREVPVAPKSREEKKRDNSVLDQLDWGAPELAAEEDEEQKTPGGLGLLLSANTSDGETAAEAGTMESTTSENQVTGNFDPSVTADVVSTQPEGDFTFDDAAGNAEAAAHSESSGSAPEEVAEFKPTNAVPTWKDQLDWSAPADDAIAPETAHSSADQQTSLPGEDLPDAEFEVADAEPRGRETTTAEHESLTLPVDEESLQIQPSSQVEIPAESITSLTKEEVAFVLDFDYKRVMGTNDRQKLGETAEMRAFQESDEMKQAHQETVALPLSDVKNALPSHMVPEPEPPTPPPHDPAGALPPHPVAQAADEESLKKLHKEITTRWPLSELRKPLPQSGAPELASAAPAPTPVPEARKEPQPPVEPESAEPESKQPAAKDKSGSSVGGFFANLLGGGKNVFDHSAQNPENGGTEENDDEKEDRKGKKKKPKKTRR